MAKELSKQIVANWVTMATGAFQIADIARELNITTEQGRSNLRVYLFRLVSDGLIEKVSGKDGIFRPIDKTANEIILTDIDLDTKVKIELPFGIHDFVEFYPGNIILVAGESNAGKTSFLYNCAVLNSGRYLTEFYTNNEASPQEILKRLKPFDLPNPLPFKIYERYDNFADVIVPGHVSIIDYLDMNSEVYLAGEEIERIHKKLGGGIAIIGMQLPPPVNTFDHGKEVKHHRKLAYGGAFTIKKPVLYLDLWKDSAANTGICYIEKAKNRAQPRIDPNYMQWKYKIDEWGAKFIKYERYYPVNTASE